MDDGIYIDIDIESNGGILAQLVAGVKELEGWTIADNVTKTSAHRIYRFNLEERRFSWWSDVGNDDIQVVIYVKQVVDILTFIREKGHLFIGIEVPAPRPEPAPEVPDKLFFFDEQMTFAEQSKSVETLFPKLFLPNPPEGLVFKNDLPYSSEDSNEYVEPKPFKWYYKKKPSLSWSTYDETYGQPYKMSGILDKALAEKMKEILAAYKAPNPI